MTRETNFFCSSGKSGSREIVLVTLENGDAEDDVEATVAALGRAGVKLSVIAREAFLANIQFQTVNKYGFPDAGFTANRDDLTAAFILCTLPGAS